MVTEKFGGHSHFISEVTDKYWGRLDDKLWKHFLTPKLS